MARRSAFGLLLDEFARVFTIRPPRRRVPTFEERLLEAMRALDRAADEVTRRG